MSTRRVRKSSSCIRRTRVPTTRARSTTSKPFRISGKVSSRSSTPRRTLYTYLDPTGKPITEAEFKIARPFNDGLACILYANTDKWGYIDTKGKLAVKPFYTGEWVDFSDGVCVIHNPKAWAGLMVDATGNVVYPMENKSTDNEHLNFIAKAQKSGDGLVGLIRTTGPHYADFDSAEFIDTKGKLRFSITEYEGRDRIRAQALFERPRLHSMRGQGLGRHRHAGELRREARRRKVRTRRGLPQRPRDREGRRQESPHGSKRKNRASGVADTIDARIDRSGRTFSLGRFLRRYRNFMGRKLIPCYY